MNYSTGYQHGYADMTAGRPDLPDPAPGSRYSAGYRAGRRDAAVHAAQLAAIAAMQLAVQAG